MVKNGRAVTKKVVGGRIHSNAVLASITGDDWTVAEYHFGNKQCENWKEIKRQLL